MSKNLVLFSWGFFLEIFFSSGWGHCPGVGVGTEEQEGGCDWQDWRATANLDAIPATMIPFRRFVQCVQATIFIEKLGGQDYLFVCITLLAQSSWSRDNCVECKIQNSSNAKALTNQTDASMHS